MKRLFLFLIPLLIFGQKVIEVDPSSKGSRDRNIELKMLKSCPFEDAFILDGEHFYLVEDEQIIGTSIFSCLGREAGLVVHGRAVLITPEDQLIELGPGCREYAKVDLPAATYDELDMLISSLKDVDLEDDNDATEPYPGLILKRNIDLSWEAEAELLEIIEPDGKKITIEDPRSPHTLKERNLSEGEYRWRLDEGPWYEFEIASEKREKELEKMMLFLEDDRIDTPVWELLKGIKCSKLGFNEEAGKHLKEFYVSSERKPQAAWIYAAFLSAQGDGVSAREALIKADFGSFRSCRFK